MLDRKEKSLNKYNCAKLKQENNFKINCGNTIDPPPPSINFLVYRREKSLKKYNVAKINPQKKLK